MNCKLHTDFVKVSISVTNSIVFADDSLLCNYSSFNEKLLWIKLK